MPARRWVLLALAGAALLLVAARAVAQIYVDYEWFEAAGALDVWRARTLTALVMRLLSGLTAGVFVFVNLYAVRHSVVSLVLPRKVANLEIGEQVSGRYLMLVVLLVSLFLGGILSLPQDDWTSFAAARWNIPFGESDPYFASDLGFFVYWLPFEQILYYWTLIALLIVTALVVFLYALTPSLRWDRGRLYISGYVRRHLTVLAGVVLLVLAWSFRLDMYGLLTAGSGPDGAFGYIDHKVLIPGNLILSIATLGAALIVVWSGWTGQGRLAGAAILGIMVLALLTREVAPFIAEHIAEEKDVRIRERPYQTTRAGYTRRAYASDAVLTADSSFAFADLADAARHVAVWDAPAIERGLETTIRGEIGSSLGWRESPVGIVADAPERSPRAGNDTTRATFGLSRVLAWDADEHGALVHAASGGREDDAQLVSALIFPGARGSLIVSDSFARIVGAPVESDASRLAHALSFQRLRWASGELPRPHPTVVAHRDVRDRLRMLLPFFSQGSVVTAIVLGDSLFWSLDLYAASAFYPLSEHLQIAGDERTYFQHAATALVYSATGETFVVADSAAGPIAQTWIQRFPTLFVSWAVLPAGLRAAIPPEIDGMRTQAVALGAFGTRTDSDVPRHTPTLDGSDSALVGTIPVFTTRTSGAPSMGVVLLDAADHVRGVVYGIGGAARRTLWYDAGVANRKWTSIIDQLHGTDSSSGGARDATIARGPIRAIPLKSGLAFVQPTYSWRAQGAPTLSRVRVLVGDSVRSAPTLAQLAGTPSIIQPTVPPLPSNADLRAHVAALYARMREALRRGDWAAFGTAFDELGKVLGGPR